MSALDDIGNGLFGQQPNYGGLLTPDDQALARRRALLSLGAGLLSQSGPSAQPHGVAQAIGSSLQQAQGVQDEGNMQALQSKLLQKKLTDTEKNDLVMTVDGKGQPQWIKTNEAAGKPAFNPNLLHPVSSLQEWAAYNAMSPSDQARYLEMKRAQQLKLGEVEGVTNAFTASAGPTPGAPKITTTPSTTVDAEAKAKSKIMGAEKEATKTAELGTERQFDQPRAESALGSSLQSLDRLKELATKIGENPNLGRVTGALGKVPNFPGSESSNLSADIKTLKSNIIQGALANIREASKTGGALGSVSTYEEEFLKNTLAAIDENVDSKKYKGSMQDIAKFADESKARLLRAYKDTYKKDFTPAAVAPDAAAQPSTSAQPKTWEDDKYQYKIGPNGKTYRKAK